MTLARTNLTLPQDLLEAIDAVAGPRGRSRYVADAVRQRLRRDQLRSAIDASSGTFIGTADALNRDEVSEWVDALRAEETA